MKRLGVEEMGENVQGVRLKGNPKRPEPESFRVVFPGGDVDVVRCDDGSYWVHVRVDSKTDAKAGAAQCEGRVVDTRADYLERDQGPSLLARDLNDAIGHSPYHLAVRVARVG